MNDTIEIVNKPAQNDIPALVTNPAPAKQYFVPLSAELEESLKLIGTDIQLINLGFVCQGHLNSSSVYSHFSEDLWVWKKVVDNEISIIATHGTTEGFCTVKHTNLYVPELIHGVCEPWIS